ncbi:dipeptide/oligopeptide/nickel ABC transporter permease/ATP-binding protein [Microbacterium phyllosphaerae]|uniref:dipeptide/oligopeptide/nickel ABC transporter permease/ATP-binding protein n=1 Tax=Microbacterium phyllosphaerae TaxID=124798 RepID=UPI002169D273|nr:dipeptide/oligopeptide/nickel ABC transporter permease/ATP-binding protein [Microbacterium phyllosphaerae]MCS3444170.1 peptide/nickel transport system permease protein [Microbacterium phyllosphaerae]
MSAAPDTELLVTKLAPRAKSEPVIIGMLKNPLGAITIAYLAIIVVMGILAPWIAPYGPNYTDLAVTNLPPFSDGHVLGGDASGRDVLSRLIYGARETLIACILVLGVSLILGTATGLIAGYYRGMVERVLEFIADSIMSLPGIVLLIALYARTGPNMIAAMTVFGILIAPTFFRLVRSVVHTVRSELYIEAAKVVGLTDLSIVGRHVLWAVRGPVIIHSAGILGAGIGIQAGIDFLGLGNPDVPSWGRVLSESFQSIYKNPIGIVWPALLISLTILAFILVGNIMRDVMQAAASTHTLKPSTRRRLRRHVRVREAKEESPEQDIVLAVRGLRLGYPSGPDSVEDVLHGVDLDLRRGEIHGLVGESGSGKSQIAFSVLGILPREAVVLGGSVFVHGKDVLNDREALRDARGSAVGYIPQEPMSNLDPSFTIGAQLIYALRAARPISKKEARARILSLLKRVGIRDAERVMTLFPHEISGGMAQRVLICGAIAPDPDIIIADEPTTALDVTVQAEVLELLRELSLERGLAMILVTHNLGVVADLCTTVSVMRAGEIVERGAVQEIFEAPRHTYTQELLRSSRSVEIIEVES